MLSYVLQHLGDASGSLVIPSKDSTDVVQVGKCCAPCSSTFEEGQLDEERACVDEQGCKESSMEQAATWVLEGHLCQHRCSKGHAYFLQMDLGAAHPYLLCCCWYCCCWCSHCGGCGYNDGGDGADNGHFERFSHHRCCIRYHHKEGETHQVIVRKQPSEGMERNRLSKGRSCQDIEREQAWCMHSLERADPKMDWDVGSNLK